MDYTGVQHTGRGGVRVTPGRLAARGPRLPVRHARCRGPWLGCTPGCEDSFPAGAGCGYLVSSSGNLVSPSLGGFRGLELVSLCRPKSAL